ncbi:hypothetical protein C8R43DRAFT_951170 [Mycena crocata]|nr:hypothetical protein C8R43DRAFT_951170 [Mycena crocata]
MDISPLHEEQFVRRTDPRLKMQVQPIMMKRLKKVDYGVKQTHIFKSAYCGFSPDIQNNLISGAFHGQVASNAVWIQEENIPSLMPNHTTSLGETGGSQFLLEGLKDEINQKQKQHEGEKQWVEWQRRFSVRGLPVKVPVFGSSTENSALNLRSLRRGSCIFGGGSAKGSNFLRGKTRSAEKSRGDDVGGKKGGDCAIQRLGINEGGNAAANDCRIHALSVVGGRVERAGFG